MPGHTSGDGIALGLLALARDDALLGVMLRRLDAQRVPASNVVVAVDNATLPIATLANTHGVALFESGCKETKTLVCKTTALLRHLVVRLPNADWYVRLSLDCFLLYPHLANALSMWRSNRFVYAGCANRLTTINTTRIYGNHFEEKQGIPEHLAHIPHAASGALFVVSAALARWFAQNWRLYYDPDKGEGSSITDDVGLGAFFHLVANAPVTDMPGVLQDPDLRFVTQKQKQWKNGTIPECPCPLPTPVHHHSQGWMRVAPFVPLEWPSLVALHASQHTWRAWEALERWHPTLAATGEQLLVYLDTPLEGDLIYQTKQLSVCRLKSEQRVASWRSSCSG